MTPLGPAPVDHDLVRALAHGPIEIDEASHAPEHSLEVQVPFLQYVLPKPRFAGVMVRYGPYRFLEEVAEVVRTAVEGRDVLIVGSTDFSHYVTPDEANRLDRLAIDAILARDATGLYRSRRGPRHLDVRDRPYDRAARRPRGRGPDLPTVAVGTFRGGGAHEPGRRVREPAARVAAFALRNGPPRLK